MIDVKELRIGNLFQFPVGEKTEYWEVSDILTKPPELYFKQNPEYDHLRNAAPILLTEDLLLKMGFIPSTIYKNVFQSAFIQTTVSPGSVSVEIACGGYEPENIELTHIAYAHQLQNLYFCLTGTELEYHA